MTSGLGFCRLLSQKPPHGFSYMDPDGVNYYKCVETIIKTLCGYVTVTDCENWGITIRFKPRASSLLYRTIASNLDPFPAHWLSWPNFHKSGYLVTQ